MLTAEQRAQFDKAVKESDISRSLEEANAWLSSESPPIPGRTAPKKVKKKPGALCAAKALPLPRAGTPGAPARAPAGARDSGGRPRRVSPPVRAPARRAAHADCENCLRPVAGPKQHWGTAFDSVAAPIDALDEHDPNFAADEVRGARGLRGLSGCVSIAPERAAR